MICNKVWLCCCAAISSFFLHCDVYCENIQLCDVTQNLSWCKFKKIYMIMYLWCLFHQSAQVTVNQAPASRTQSLLLGWSGKGIVTRMCDSVIKSEKAYYHKQYQKPLWQNRNTWKTRNLPKKHHRLLWQQGRGKKKKKRLLYHVPLG